MASVTSVYGNGTYGDPSSAFVINSGNTLKVGVSNGVAVGGGTALNGVIQAGATLVVSSGSDYSAPVLSDVTFMGNVINYVRSDAQGVDVGGFYLSNVNIFSGAAGSNFIWSPMVDGMVISGGSVKMQHARGSDFIIRSGGLLYIFGNSANISDVVVSGGIFSVGSGVVVGATVSGGVMRFSMGKGVGTLSNTIVRGGELDIMSGVGVVGNVVGMQISGGVVNFSAGEMSGNVTDPAEMTGGTFRVISGAIRNFSVNGGKMYFSAGELTSALMSDGTLSITGGTVNALQVQGGTVNANGGTLADLCYRQGSLTLSNTELTGSLNLCQSITVNNTVTFSDLTLNLILTERAASAPALISDYTIFQGASGFAATVSFNQAAGTYQLMGNAAGFSGSLDVYSGVELIGSISVGGSCTGLFSKYTLTCDGDSVLCLTVESISSEPIVLYKDGERVSSCQSVSGLAIGSASVYDKMYVLSGGSAVNTNLKSGGIVTLTDGAIFSGGTVSAGFLNMEGGSVNAVVMQNGSAIINGGVVSGLDFRGGTGAMFGGAVSALNATDGILNVSGGTLYDAAIHDMGNVIVSYEGRVSGGTVTDFGMITVGESGVVSGFTAGSDGNLFVSNCGSGLDLTAEAGGFLWLDVGGSASGIVLSSGGILCVESNAKVVGIDQKAGGAIEVTDFGADKTLISGAHESGTFRLQNGVGSGFLLNENAFIVVEKGGSFYDTIVNSNGWFFIESDAFVQGVAVNPGAEIFITSGATVTGITQAVGGKLNFEIDADDAGKTLISGTNAGGTFRYSGGVASNVILYDGAWQYISAGTALDTTVSSGAEQIAVSEGLASGTRIKNGGLLSLEEGGSAQGTIVSAGGVLSVSANCRVAGTTVKNNGTLELNSGAVHSGALTIENGAVISAAQGSLFDTALYELAPGAAPVYADYTAIKGAPSFNVTINASEETGSYALIGNASGFTGSISVTEVCEGKIADLAVGETVVFGGNSYTLTQSGTTVCMVAVRGGGAGGTVIVYEGSTPVYSGGIYTMAVLDGDPQTSMYVSGGTARFTTVRTGGSMTMDTGLAMSTSVSGGTASLSGGTVDLLEITGGEVSLNAASAAGVTLGNGTLNVTGGTVNNLNASGGVLDIRSGIVSSANVSATVVRVGKEAVLSGMNVTKGSTSGAIVEGTVYDMTVTGSSTYELILNSGGVISGLTLANGVTNGINIGAGAIVKDLVVLSTGSPTGSNVRISGGVVNATVSGGVLKLFGNGYVDGIIDVSSGAVLEQAYNSTQIRGTANISSGAVYNVVHKNNVNTRITSGAVVNLCSGAVMSHASKSLAVEGTINVRGGRILNGTTTAATGLVFSGGQLNFLLDGAEPQATAYVENFAALSGNYSCTVSVSSAQTGEYILFGNASTFSRSVNLSVDGIVRQETLSLTQSVKVGDVIYSLALNGSDLVFRMESLYSHSIRLYEGSTLVSSGAYMAGVTLDGSPFTKLEQDAGLVSGLTVANGGSYVMTGGIADQVTNNGTTASTLISGAGTLTGLTLQTGNVSALGGALISGAGVSGGMLSVLSGGTVEDLSLLSGGTVILQNGAVVSGADIRSYVSGGVILSSGAVMEDAVIRTSGNESGVQVGGVLRNTVISAGAINNLVVLAGGSAEEITFFAGARISGTLNNAGIHGVQVRLFKNGRLRGVVNVHGTGGVDMAYSSTKIDGVLNLLDTGSYLLARHQSASLNTEITVNGEVNVFSGAYMGNTEGGKVSNLTINGKINLHGGRISNAGLLNKGESSSTINHNWVFGASGSLNFNLAGLSAADSAYVVSYNNLNKSNDAQGVRAATGSAFTITVDVSSGSLGNYILFGDASEFASRNQTISLSIDGTAREATLAAGGVYVDVAENVQYVLNLADDAVTLSGTTYTPASQSTTSVISTEVNGGRDVAATWDNSTNYSTGIVAIGNASKEYEHTALVINNDGTVGSKTLLFGGAASGDVAGEVDVNFLGGTIQAIMGGAATASGKVGAVNLTLGGTSSAVTTVVYGGGYGSVDGDVKTVLNSGAQIGYSAGAAAVGGQIYGGPLVLSDANNAVNVGGDIILDVEDAVIFSDIIGGARVLANGSNTTTVDGVADIAINGGTFSGGKDTCLYGAGWIVGTGSFTGSTDYSIGGVNISVTDDAVIGSANGRGIFGGALATQGATAVVNGDVNIAVTGKPNADKVCVGNIFGGGWAQTAAKSNVLGNVTIRLANAEMTGCALIGGGAHAVAAVVTDLGSTLVDGDVSITVEDSDVESIFAAGQVVGDTVSGDVSVTLRGTSVIGRVMGCGYDEINVCGGSATLTLDDFAGYIGRTIKAFDDIVLSGDTTATILCGDAEVENDAWLFDLTEKSSNAAMLRWDGGSFYEDTIRLDLSGTNVGGWTVFDLSGDNLDENAVVGTQFDLYVDSELAGSVTFTEEVKSYIITGTGTGWDNAILDYSKEGLLTFQLA